MQRLRESLICLASTLALVACQTATKSEARADAQGSPAESGAERHHRVSAEGNVYVSSKNPAHPRVRYVDGQLSVNESCAIQLGNKLNRAIPPMFINGRPIGFC